MASRLAWLAWRHPNMPWDGCELWLADLDAAGALPTRGRSPAARRSRSSSLEWSPDGILVFAPTAPAGGTCTDCGRRSTASAQALAPMDAEFAGPQWVFGLTWYGIDVDGTVISIAHRQETR